MPTNNKKQRDTAPPPSSVSQQQQQQEEEEDEEYEYEEVEVDEEENETENENEQSPQTKNSSTNNNNNNNNNNKDPSKSTSRYLELRKQRKKQNFDESDSDLWSEIGLEKYRHPNHRWPPRIREVSTTEDEFKIIVNSTRLCGLECNAFLAYFELFLGISCVVVGILCFVLWREDFGFFTNTTEEGITWTCIIAAVCFLFGGFLLIHCWNLHETIINFDRKSQRIRARSYFLVFGSGCFSSRSEREILDIHVSDVKRISVEGYSDGFWYRRRTGKQSRFDPYFPVHLVLRFDPDKNAAAALQIMHSSNNNSSFFYDGTQNNCLIMARHPYFKAANRIRYWQNYFIEGLGADREQVMSWRKDWVQDVGHFDSEQVDLRVARFWKRKRIFDEMRGRRRKENDDDRSDDETSESDGKNDGRKNMTRKVRSNVIRYGDDEVRKNRQDNTEEDDEEFEEVEEVEEVEEEQEEENERKTPKSPTSSSTNNKKKNKVRPTSTESTRPLNENDERPVETLKRKSDKKASSMTKEDQAKLHQSHRTKLEVLLSRTKETQNSTSNRIPIPSSSSSSLNFIPGITNNSKQQQKYNHLLTPRTIDAFAKLGSRQQSEFIDRERQSILRNQNSTSSSSVSHQSQKYFSQIREYHARLSFLRAPVALFMMIFPPSIVVLLAIVGTILRGVNVIAVDDGSMTIVAIVFGVAVFVVLLIEFFVYFYFYLANDIRIRMDFRKRKMYYERGYNIFSSSASSDGGGKNIIEIDFHDLVKVTVSEHLVLKQFSSGEQTCIMLHFKDHSKEAKESHVYSVLKSVPLCVLPSRLSTNNSSSGKNSTSDHHQSIAGLISKPYLQGWEDFIQHALNTLEQNYDRRLAVIGGVHEMSPPPQQRVTASPAPLPSPSPERRGEQITNKHPNNFTPHARIVTFHTPEDPSGAEDASPSRDILSSDAHSSPSASPSTDYHSSRELLYRNNNNHSSNTAGTTGNNNTIRETRYARGEHQLFNHERDSTHHRNTRNGGVNRFQVHHLRELVERRTNSPAVQRH